MISLYLASYLPYLSIAIVGLSYCCGYAINIILHCLIARIWPKHAYDANDEIELLPDIDDATRRRVTSSYFTLLLFRHLTLGSVVLEDCLTYWLTGTQFKWQAIAVILPLSGLALISGLAYWIHRRNHLALNKYVRQHANQVVR